MTQDDVQNLIDSEINKGVRSNQIAAAREKFIRSKMGDLPPAYRAMLVHSDDAAALESHEKQIRDEYNSDIAAHTAKVTPPGQIDTNGMSSQQLIHLGLREAESGKPPTAPVATPYTGNNPYLLFKEGLKAG